MHLDELHEVSIESSIAKFNEVPSFYFLYLLVAAPSQRLQILASV